MPFSSSGSYPVVVSTIDVKLCFLGFVMDLREKKKREKQRQIDVYEQALQS